MFKVAAIGLTIAASLATAVIPSSALVSDGNVKASHTARAAQRIYFESAQCRAAARLIAVYSRALSRLDMAIAHNHYKAAIYLQSRQSEQDWHAQNCRLLAQTARGDR